MEKWDYCIQGQGHSEGLNVSECLFGYFLWVSDCVCSVSSELLNRILPNLVWWCIMMWQCGCVEKLVHYHHCQGHSEGLYN